MWRERPYEGGCSTAVFAKCVLVGEGGDSGNSSNGGQKRQRPRRGEDNQDYCYFFVEMADLSCLVWLSGTTAVSHACVREAVQARIHRIAQVLGVFG